MNIATYETAIKTWLEAQTGLTAQSRDAEGGWQTKARVRWHFFGIDGLGVDVQRWNVDGTLPAGS